MYQSKIGFESVRNGSVMAVVNSLAVAVDGHVEDGQDAFDLHLSDLRWLAGALRPNDPTDLLNLKGVQDLRDWIDKQISFLTNRE